MYKLYSNMGITEIDNYNVFSVFIDSLERRERDTEFRNTLIGFPCEDMEKVKKHEIKSRLSLSSEEKIHKVVNIILSRSSVCFSVLNKELKNSIMGYQTNLKQSLPKHWTISDFEELKFIMFGQKEE